MAQIGAEMIFSVLMLSGVQSDLLVKLRVEETWKQVELAETLILSIMKVHRNTLNTVFGFFPYNHTYKLVWSFWINSHVPLSEEVLMRWNRV